MAQSLQCIRAVAFVYLSRTVTELSFLCLVASNLMVCNMKHEFQAGEYRNQEKSVREPVSCHKIMMESLHFHAGTIAAEGKMVSVKIRGCRLCQRSCVQIQGD